MTDSPVPIPINMQIISAAVLNFSSPLTNEIVFSPITSVELNLEVVPPSLLQFHMPLEQIPGLSAYQIAVANGFVGTETQWLLSLKGPPGDSLNTDPGDLAANFLLGLPDNLVLLEA